VSTKNFRRTSAAALFALLSSAAITASAEPGEHAQEHAAPAEHGEHAAPAEHGEHAAPAERGEHAAPAERGEHAEPSEHAGAHGGHHGPASMNWMDLSDTKRPAFVAVAINFGILLALYYVLGKKPVAAALKQRRVTIGKDIDEAQKLLDEAKERAKKYQSDLNNVEADAKNAKDALIATGKGEVEALLTEAQEKSARMKRDAERLVEQERKSIQQSLLEETADLASEEAAELLRKTVTAEDHARLADDLLAELAARPAARTTGAPL
jgi:F-type H+-transporting ATPase subunit b